MNLPLPKNLPPEERARLLAAREAQRAQRAAATAPATPYTGPLHNHLPLEEDCRADCPAYRPPPPTPTAAEIAANNARRAEAFRCRLCGREGPSAGVCDYC